MLRSIRTWIVLAAVLATAPTSAIAAGPKLARGVLAGSFKAPAVKRTVAPSLNQALKLRPATSSSSQLQATRAANLQNSSLANSVRNLVSPGNNGNLNLTRTNLGTPRFTVDNNPYNRGTLPQTNPLVPSGTTAIGRPNGIGNAQLDVIRRQIGGGNLRLVDGGNNDNSGNGGLRVPGDLANSLRERARLFPPIGGTGSADNPTGGASPITPITATPLPPERRPIDRGADPIGPIIGTPMPPEREPIEPPREVEDPDGYEEEPIPVDPGTVFDPGALLGDLLSPIVAGITQPAPSDGGTAGEAGESALPAVEAPAQLGAVEQIDVELIEVRLVDAGSATEKVGPRFRLFYRNNGTVEVPKFHVSVMVDLGKELSDAAQIATVEAAGLKPRESRSVDVQLPFEALMMTTENDQWARPFETLAAFLDSHDSLTETDEDNNILLVARNAIKTLD